MSHGKRYKKASSHRSSSLPDVCQRLHDGKDTVFFKMILSHADRRLLPSNILHVPRSWVKKGFFPQNIIPAMWEAAVASKKDASYGHKDPVLVADSLLRSVAGSRKRHTKAAPAHHHPDQACDRAQAMTSRHRKHCNAQDKNSQKQLTMACLDLK